MQVYSEEFPRDSVDHAVVAAHFPSAYAGTVLLAGSEYSIVDVATALKLPVLLKRFGAWAVTKRGIHCLTAKYFIGRARLGERDWIAHMRSKPDVNMDDFAEALSTARAFVDHGIII